MAGSGGVPDQRVDVCVVGGGVLGTCIAFWISKLVDCSIALVEMEERVATHASGRNTGVVHRPFYMNPEKKGRFARTAAQSMGMWKELAQEYGLPWRTVGILEVATDQASLPALEDYLRWGPANGMKENELVRLDPAQVREMEPQVACLGAVLSKLDAAVDYRKFTECLLSLAQKNGVRFFGGKKVSMISHKIGGVSVGLRGLSGESTIECGFLVNASGGGALKLAHSVGIAKKYAELHFRGDFWNVNDQKISTVKHNLYSVPKRSEYPFLDPHLVLRADGRVEIGPNAAVVAGPYVYDGFGGMRQTVSALFSGPKWPKLRLFVDSEFLSMAREEWRRSVSKKAMCDRVSEFLPSLTHEMVGSKGAGGVRNNLVDAGGFVPEVIEEWSEHSLHILNYNSPGATGAPVFSARLVSKMIERGHLPGQRKDSQSSLPTWNFDFATAS